LIHHEAHEEREGIPNQDGHEKAQIGTKKSKIGNRKS